MALYNPTISCVVIGLNSGGTIEDCLRSVKQSSYPAVAEIIYVDGGSSDKSVAIAKSIEGVKVIELNLKNPTPGRGRNAGWKIASGEWIQFFDGDTIAERQWLSEAVKNIEPDTAAIFGWRKEKYPDKNWFHMIADLEWRRPVGDIKFFGGDVLIRRSILERTGGYDESLVAGEDPELGVRIRNTGQKIKGIDALMSYHDINTSTLWKYLKRGIRDGYAYAATATKMFKEGEGRWLNRMLRVLIKAILVILLITIMISAKVYILAPFIIAVIFSPIAKINYFRRKFNISFKKAFLYSLHCSLTEWPVSAGILKYALKRNK